MQQANTQPLIQANFFCQLDYLGLICVSGLEAEKFLQGQLSCDVREVNQQQSRLGAYCNPKGRVLASFRLFYFENNYYLCLPRIMIADTLVYLKKYAIFAKVTLTDASNDFATIGCFGDQVYDYFSHAYLQPPTQIDAAINTQEAIIICVPGEQPRFIIFVKSAAIQAIQNNLPINSNLQTADSWNYLDIIAGLATIYPETRELFTPHMLNYPLFNAVSFTKGCYVGQEIIARTEYLGKSKRSLHIARANDCNQPMLGEKLFSENIEIGNIINCVKINNLQYYLLIVIQDNALGKDIFLDNQTLVELIK